jgi:hypothetical protein
LSEAHENKFLKELGDHHADENEATHKHAHSDHDFGPNAIGPADQSDKEHEKINPQIHANLGIDSVHHSKIVHKLDLDESEFGTFLNIRPPSKMKPVTTAPCVKREEDGLYTCLPGR